MNLYLKKLEQVFVFLCVKQQTAPYHACSQKHLTSGFAARGGCSMQGCHLFLEQKDERKDDGMNLAWTCMNWWTPMVDTFMSTLSAKMLLNTAASWVEVLNQFSRKQQERAAMKTNRFATRMTYQQRSRRPSLGPLGPWMLWLCQILRQSWALQRALSTEWT